MKARKRTNTVLWLGLVALALWWLWPERGSEPEDRLVAHMDATCEIAKKNVKTPERGVRKLFAYLGKHSPTMMKEFGELLVTIERIPGDKKHDERARKAARRLQGAGRRCEPHWERFFQAVERDPEARELFEKGTERLSRTLEILFGARSAALPHWAGKGLMPKDAAEN